MGKVGSLLVLLVSEITMIDPTISPRPEKARITRRFLHPKFVRNVAATKPRNSTLMNVSKCVLFIAPDDLVETADV